MNNENFIDKNRAYKLGLVFITLLSIFVFVKIIGEARAYRFIGSNPDVTSTISVTGKGEIFATPDVATFNFGAIAEATSATAAQQSIVAKMKPALDYLKEKGVEEKDIKTISYNVYPKYESTGRPCTPYSCPEPANRISGYEASQTVEVKVRNTELAGELISGVTDKGANNVSGLDFSVDDEELLLSEARKLAIDDAKSKAMVLAKDLDVKLVRIVQFTENMNGRPIYMKEYALTQDSAGVGAPVAAPLPMGENKITTEVTITYEIR